MDLKRFFIRFGSATVGNEPLRPVPISQIHIPDHALLWIWCVVWEMKSMFVHHLFILFFANIFRSDEQRRYKSWSTNLKGGMRYAGSSAVVFKLSSMGTSNKQN